MPTNILESREKLTPIVDKVAGVHLTITDILMKITACGDFPSPHNEYEMGAGRDNLV